MMGLIIVLLLVLFLPFTVKKVEHNLEVFLFIMGIIAANISGMMDAHLIKKALIDPINITLAVLIAGLLCKWFQGPMEKSILWGSRKLSPRLFFALTVVVLGIISSVITAIIAAIVLVIIINVLPLDRKSEVKFTVLACFSIGLGAALTPIGEPLSTITLSKLNEDFFYLLDLIGAEVISAVIIFGILTMILVAPHEDADGLKLENRAETYKEIIVRSLKIYLFVMG